MKSKTFMQSAILALSFIINLSSASAEEIRVYNWYDYIDPQVLKDFEKETGIKVIYDLFDSNEILETKLLTGKSGYDVVFPSNSFLARQIKAGVFQKLDKSKLKNLGNLWDFVVERLDKFDPGLQYSVNYTWGTTGIGFNKEKVEKAIGKDAPFNSWALVFEPENMKKLQSCGVHFIDSASEVIPTVLAYLGEDPNTTDPKTLAKAEKKLLEISPYVLKFGSADYIGELANGNICVALGWSGDVFIASDRAAEAKKGIELEYSIPKEGALMWLDEMAIPADAPNPEGAHKFIDFMLRPEVAAANTNFHYTASGNKAAQKLISEEIIDNPAIYPSQDVQKRLFGAKIYNNKEQRALNRIWTKVKTGR